MKEIKILEIPIYSMKENEFENKWKKYFEKYFKGNSHFQDIKNSYYPQNVWKYNQIIGYLEITYSNKTIWLNEYCTADKKIYAKSTKKHYIIDMGLNGYHFFVKNEMKNEDIINEILFWITSFEK